MMRFGKIGVLALVFLAVSTSVFADQEDTWNLVAGGFVSNDSNLFRSGSGNEVSDQIKALTAGVRVNKAFSMQRVVVDASVTDFHYRDNSYLDYLGKNATASWQWAVTPQVHGTLSTNYSEVLNNFTDYSASTPALRKNVRTLKTHRLDAEWEAFGRVHLIGGVSRTTQENSQPFLEEGDYAADAVEYGAKYVMPSGAQVTVIGRNTDGEYKKRTINVPAQYDSGFSQKDIEARFFWPATQKSTFNGRIARIDRKHDNFSSRDYDGTTGSLDYTLDLTGKVRLAVGVKKDLASSQSGFSSYYETRGYSFTPSWRISPKVSLQARYNHETRDYQHQGISTLKDTLIQKSLSLNWSPLRALTLSATLQRDTRDSEIHSRDFSANIVNVSANVLF